MWLTLSLLSWDWPLSLCLPFVCVCVCMCMPLTKHMPPFCAHICMSYHRSPAQPSQIKTHSSKRWVCSALLLPLNPSLPPCPLVCLGLQQQERRGEEQRDGWRGGQPRLLLEWVLICVLTAEDAAEWRSGGNRCISACALIHLRLDTHTHPPHVQIHTQWHLLLHPVVLSEWLWHWSLCFLSWTKAWCAVTVWLISL